MSEESEVLDEDWGKRTRTDGRNCRGMKVGKWGKTAKETIKGQNSGEEEDETCFIIKFHFH